MVWNYVLYFRFWFVSADQLHAELKSASASIISFQRVNSLANHQLLLSDRPGVVRKDKTNVDHYKPMINK